MPRQPRSASPTGCFHVTSRAVQPLRLFADGDDCAAFLHGVRLVACRDWCLFAFCLMGTHFHLLVRAAPEALTAGLRRLKGAHAHRINTRLGRAGPVFDKRYHAGPITSEPQVVATAVYIDLNPARAGLCAHPAEWPHSSYRYNAGLERRPAWLSPLADIGVASGVAYRELVEDTMRKSGLGSDLLV